LRVGDRDAFVAVFGADAAEVLLLVAEELDALDDDGVFEELALEDGLGQDGVELGVTLLEGAGEAVAWGVQELGLEWSCGCGGERGGEEGAAGGHVGS